MEILETPYVKDVIYRYVGGDAIDGILSCGWFPKPTSASSQIDFTIPYYSCFVLLNGSGKYYDELGNECELSAGSVVQRLPDVKHSTQVYDDGKWVEFYISFGKSTYLFLQSLGYLSKDNPVKKTTITPELLSGFVKLLDQMKISPDSQLLSVLLNAQKQAVKILSQPSESQSKADLISKACIILSESLQTDITAKDVAKELCIGYESFRKLFKQYNNISPNKYRIEKKMMNARIMLLGGLTVKATARELGYSDEYIFSKQFKNYTGVWPSQYLNFK